MTEEIQKQSDKKEVLSEEQLKIKEFIEKNIVFREELTCDYPTSLLTNGKVEIIDEPHHNYDGAIPTGYYDKITDNFISISEDKLFKYIRKRLNLPIK